MSPPPGVCPRPGTPVTEASSVACPLWSARERLALQRSIETDSAAHAGLSALVWADLNRRPRRAALLPSRPSLPTDLSLTPIEARRVTSLLADEALTAEPANEKGVLSHA